MGLDRLDNGVGEVAKSHSQMPGAPFACRRREGRGRLKRVTRPKSTEMDRQVAGALYAVAMVAVIVGVDFAFFRNRFWERLMVNVGIVLVFAAFYLRFFRRS